MRDRKGINGNSFPGVHVQRQTPCQTGIQLQFCPLPKTWIYLQTVLSSVEEFLSSWSHPIKGEGWPHLGDVAITPEHGRLWKTSKATTEWAEPWKEISDFRVQQGLEGFWWRFSLVAFSFKPSFLFCLTLRFLINLSVCCSGPRVQTLLVSLATVARECCCSCPQSRHWLETHQERGNLSTDRSISTQMQYEWL